MATDQDPRGWLEACPALHQFASDPEVASAIAAGDARKLHAALARRRKGKRGAFEGRAIDAVLAHRRLFTMPVVKAPSLTTLNGIGSRLWGKSDAASDGTYVTTLFFTVLFLPLWPIAQYLVRSDGNQYAFFGELPLSAGLRTWRRAVGALAVAGAVAAGLAIWKGGSAAEVQLLNGLDYEVAVEAGGVTRKVAPGRRAVAEVPVGRQRFRATAADGRLVEEIEVEVPRYTDLVVYNPVGAAALYVEPVIYLAKGEKGTSRSAPAAMYAGKPFVARDAVHYPFRAAPAEVKLESSQKQQVRWHADVLEGGWRAALQALVWEGRTADAATLAGRLAVAQPGTSGPHLQRIVLSNWAQGPEAALSAAREAAAALPGDADVHRQLTYFLLATGRRDEARRLLEERAAREPDSALAQYLRARIEPLPAALPAFEGLARRFPADANVHRGLGWAYLSAGRGADAIREWDACARLAADGAMPLERQAEALVSAGRVGEARERVAAALGSPDG
ncbi:MAG TPA: tetratricopeptide repeat protein, partial [Anaeromyxobacter sp.]